MPVGAGRLDTRVKFQKQVKTSDDGGGSTITWSDQFTVWGAFSFPRLRSRMEAIAAGAVQTVNSGELTVRDTTKTRQITKDWRAVVTRDHTTATDDLDVWNVRKVYPRERNGLLRLEVEEGVPT